MCTSRSFESNRSIRSEVRRNAASLCEIANFDRRVLSSLKIHGQDVRRNPANVALCTVSQGYGGRAVRGARAGGGAGAGGGGGGGSGGGGGGGGGGRLRGDASARLPLSPRNLCASGAGARGGAHGATVATSGIGGTEEAAGSGLPDEPMVHVERSAHQGTWICCVPCYWLRRSKAVHKALLTFAMMLVTSLLVTSPVLFLITTLPEGEQPRKCAPLDEACVRERDGPEGVCDTDVCVEASKRILTSMKRGVDPCKDFYKFACGGFRDQQPYQPSASFNILQAQIDERIHSERFAQFS
ncbi:uncharacterized protein LOC112465319, partial [Temnothorax curvispinosus]|uniref:Uncharacterized protein LOC112452570 n=1 Tax=Temnothorax curvispinosus TaxID=300111 RepID=A0A6J1R6M9_9HYME